MNSPTTRSLPFLSVVSSHATEPLKFLFEALAPSPELKHFNLSLKVHQSWLNRTKEYCVTQHFRQQQLKEYTTQICHYFLLLEETAALMNSSHLPSAEAKPKGATSSTAAVCPCTLHGPAFIRGLENKSETVHQQCQESTILAILSLLSRIHGRKAPLINHIQCYTLKRPQHFTYIVSVPFPTTLQRPIVHKRILNKSGQLSSLFPSVANQRTLKGL